MQRPQDWKSRLGAWAHEQLDKPFEWGTTDCATLVRDAVGVMFNGDVSADVRRYDSLRGAAEVLAEVGGTLKWLEAHGSVPVDQNYIQVGDVVILPQEPEEIAEGAAVVVVREHVLVTSPNAVVSMVRLDSLPLSAIVLRPPYVWE